MLLGKSLPKLMNFFLTFSQPELYLCTPIKVDYTNDYYIGECRTKQKILCTELLLGHVFHCKSSPFIHGGNENIKKRSKS